MPDDLAATVKALQSQVAALVATKADDDDQVEAAVALLTDGNDVFNWVSETIPRALVAKHGAANVLLMAEKIERKGRSTIIGDYQSYLEGALDRESQQGHSGGRKEARKFNWHVAKDVVRSAEDLRFLAATTELGRLTALSDDGLAPPDAADRIRKLELRIWELDGVLKPDTHSQEQEP